MKNQNGHLQETEQQTKLCLNTIFDFKYYWCRHSKCTMTTVL